MPSADDFSLPSWTYLDAEFLALERERIFRPSWQVICHVAEIPNAGDYQCLDFLGESLFRMANLLLETGGGIRSPFWRETVAAAVSPSTAFNRWLQGRGPATVFSSADVAGIEPVDPAAMTGACGGPAASCAASACSFASR